jgi:hypothetical protein
MGLWTFLACPAPGGGRPISRFLLQLGPEAENDLAAILDNLGVLERQYWRRPQFDVLTGKSYKGMGEVRFDGEKKTYRLFGYFGPKRFQFTFLIGCEKKGRLKREMDEAAKRKKFAEENEKLLYAFTFEILSL